jgi:hypothetical protein
MRSNKYPNKRLKNVVAKEQSAPLRRLEEELVRTVMNKVFSHSVPMKKQATAVLLEMVKNKCERRPEHIQFPFWAFGHPHNSEQAWLQEVYFYARVPSDLEWESIADDRKQQDKVRVSFSLPPMPDETAFFETLQLPEAAVKKKNIAISIALIGHAHSSPMKNVALSSLAACISKEVPGHPDTVMLPYWAFGQELNTAREWLALVYRYACIPDDVEWERTEERVAAHKTEAARIAAIAQKDEKMCGDSIGVVAGVACERGEVTVSIPSGAYTALLEELKQKNTLVEEARRHFVHVPSDDYAALLDELKQNKRLAEEARRGVAALCTALSYRGNERSRIANLPVWPLENQWRPTSSGSRLYMKVVASLQMLHGDGQNH